jgi:hypothetical protein
MSLKLNKKSDESLRDYGRYVLTTSGILPHYTPHPNKRYLFYIITHLHNESHNITKVTPNARTRQTS